MGRFSAGETRRILVAESDAGARHRLRTILLDSGWPAVLCEDRASVLRALVSGPYSHFLLDLGLPGQLANDLVRIFRGLGNEGHVVLMAHAFHPDVKPIMLAYGRVEWLVKPFDLRHLQEVLDRAAIASRGS